MPADGGERTTSRVERVLALRTFPGLAQVDASELAVLAEIARERTFSKGRSLSTRGEPLRSFHFIRGGKVSVLHDGVATRHYGPSDIIGAIALLARDPRGQHVVAEEETRTFEVHGDDFDDVLEESFSLLLAALRGTLRAALAARLEIPGDAGFPSGAEEAARAPLGRGLVERVLFLRRLLTYGRARVEALAELGRDMVEVRAAAGTELWRAGDAAPFSLLLASGSVACETDRGQRFRFGTESVLGGIDSIAGEPRWYRAVAESDVVALRSDVAHLIDVLEEHPDMGLAMLQSAARILVELHERLDRRTLAER